MATAIKNNAYTRNYEFNFGFIPETTFEITSCPLPAISMGVAIQPSPYHDIKIPGDKAEFDPLIIEFIVDEEFKSYLEILNWIQTMRTIGRNPGAIKDVVSDAHLRILSNNHIPISTFRFEGVFPSLLGEIQFSTQDGTEVQVCSASFQYTDFDVVKP